MIRFSALILQMFLFFPIFACESDFFELSPSLEIIEKYASEWEMPYALVEQNEIPEWASEESYGVEKYYALHSETKLDRFLRTFACNLGVIIHAKMTPEMLEDNLRAFDIERLFKEGPHFTAILSISAQELIYESLSSYDKVIDIHLHNLGYDEGNFLNPKAAAYKTAKWKDYLTFLVLRYAAGMSSPIGSTQNARRRMQLYAEHFPKLCGMILPIHQAFQQDGKVDWEKTGSYLCNNSAIKTAKTYSNPTSKLFPAISVHPFDPNWREKLHDAYAKGIRLVKWMPPQSIPPDSDQIAPFYEEMINLGMILIAHGGPEHTIPTNEDNEAWQDFGNPLRFRKPLQMGVTIILAHSGHKDLIQDLDVSYVHKVPGYQLFFRLAKEAQENMWPGKLYGDLAAVTTHYGPDFIKELLLKVNEEGIRFIYGSDYPFTNIIKPKADAYKLCAKYGLFDPKLVKPLKEIRAWNPLLANFIFTRKLALTVDDGQVLKFPDATFTGQFQDGELMLIDDDAWCSFCSSSKTSQIY